jgi:NACalpha-BTF3-like transcription factor
LKLKEIRFPQIFVQLGNLLYPFINTPSQSMSSFSTTSNFSETAPRQTNTSRPTERTTTQTNTNESTRNTTTNVPSARQEYVQILVEMGFSRENAVQALITTNNDLQRATEALIY